MPLDVYTQCTVTRSWPTLPVYDEPDGYSDALDRQIVLKSGFLRARGGLLSAIPSDASERGRAFPTPRTWDYASRLAAFADAVGANREVKYLLVAGCVGENAAHEFLAWVANNDLPDPEQLLADPKSFSFKGLRSDRTYVALQSVLAAVARKKTTPRWTAAVKVCCAAALVGSIDPAVPIVRALLERDLRPVGAALPPEIKVFQDSLRFGGLL